MGTSRSHSATDRAYVVGNRTIAANSRRWRLPLPLAFVVGAAGPVSTVRRPSALAPERVLRLRSTEPVPKTYQLLE